MSVFVLPDSYKSAVRAPFWLLIMPTSHAMLEPSSRFGVCRRFLPLGQRRICDALRLSFWLLFFFSSALISPVARAGEVRKTSWEVEISEFKTTPEFIFAVDKSRQQLALFERRSPLRLSRLFTCTTGQAVGDKEVEGDLKTPEGVYFVVQRIGGGLEFLKYGNEAYTLNYPNPVDRLRKKTGYGIWIHGRGEPIAPLQTQGCVSMNNEDLASLGALLRPGTPVLLTESFSHSQTQDAATVATVRTLEEKVRAWAKAWGQRSPSMFSFYDKEAYSLAQGEPFSRFQKQKERLFKMLPWIKNSISDIRVLQGPGYWVTWFYQDYQAPNLSTRGIRRLYWGKDASGDFKILGMEWSPGLTTGVLLASAEPALPPLESRPRTEGETPAPSASQASGATASDKPVQVKAGGSPQPETSAGAVPAVQEPGTVNAMEKPDTVRLAAAGSGTAKPAAAREPVAESGKAQLTAAELSAPSGEIGAASGARPVEGQTAPAIQDSVKPSAGLVVTAPDNAAPADQGPFADHVEDPRYGKMAEPPLRPGARNVASATPPVSSDSSNARAALALPPPLPAQGLAVVERPVVEKDAPSVVPPLAQGTARPGKDLSVAESPVSTPANSGEGVPLKSADNNGAEPLEGQAPLSLPERVEYPRPASDKNLPPEAPAVPGEANVTERVAERVEAWRAAWEAGNVDSYAAFYAPKARQEARRSAASIRKHKERLWRNAAPASVILEDIAIRMEEERVVVTALQTYRDSKGQGDRGRKTLHFEKTKGLWLITQENWSPLVDEANH